MEIITQPIPVAVLKQMAENMFGTMIKVVVDINRGIMAVDGELHADEEALLLEEGSLQKDLWGINIYPGLDRTDSDFIEFDSMINMRPSQNNRSRSVDDPGIRKTIVAVVNKLIS